MHVERLAWPHASVSALSRLRASFSVRGRQLLERLAPPAARQNSAGSRGSDTLIAYGEALLSTRGEASGGAIARDIIDLYDRLVADERAAFFTALGRRFGPDREAIQRAWERYGAVGEGAFPDLARAVEPPRLEFFRRLNLAPDGTGALVRMRADLLSLPGIAEPSRSLIEADLSHLLQSWFNRGFLTMVPITWSSPARLLENVIHFEAVHHIRDWEDLRSRLDPPDRRCYAFVHKAMPDTLLIFVEVALTKGLATSIQAILAPGRVPLAAPDTDTANFYSISNCQDGLRGISFGHFLIKQVATELKRELPNLETFATLSPMPGFLSWLSDTEPHVVQQNSGPASFELLEDRRAWLVERAADYLVSAKNPQARPLDPVARFHLGNGARLERLNWAADISARGLRQSAGLMVNYLYDLRAIEENHEAYAERGAITVAPAIRDILAKRASGSAGKKGIAS